MSNENKKQLNKLLSQNTKEKINELQNLAKEKGFVFSIWENCMIFRLKDRDIEDV